MMFSEEKVLASLSENETRVYDYIKTKAESNDNRTLKESMRKISGQLGISEATVHRAVQKLRTNGVIEIVPSREKTESNEIVFYGIPEPDEQVSDIFKMVGSLSSGVKRFETILSNLSEENKRLTDENNKLKKELNIDNNHKLKNKLKSEDLSADLFAQLYDLEEENKALKKRLEKMKDRLNEELEKAQAAQAGIDTTKIIRTQPLKDGTIVYIVKK
ncbi:winged helix-turn-helix transcriptional regulator [Bacillus halotolerans]|uniref:Winged helix-turn-helix transcriptional regulator n=1 Tax=Bacillus halotolerans TaxID=260554 RepID=A0A9Q4EMJ0_9BACI|nr:winged helix-turn-helix transcriptional regulator [Bacillus halotolerans]MCY9186522.1 winged helix-turn-helix transcriptional regulator [Bacillus halotolerans]